MSTTSSSISTPSNGANSGIEFTRGVYTYSFLGGMGLIALIVLFFVAKAYARRRQFAIRVQRALDSGRLDPAIVNEIRSLPSGALYFSSKLKKQKPRPLLYEVYLGEPADKKFAGAEGDNKLEDGIDWKSIKPVAVTKLTPESSVEPTPVPDTTAMTKTTARRTLTRFHFITPRRSLSETQFETRPGPPATNANQSSQPALPANATSSETTTVSPSDSLVLSVFIAVPSSSSRLGRAKIDGEEAIPDICLGVTRVEVVG